VLATGQKSWFGLRSGSNLEPDHLNGFWHTKIRFVAIRLVLSPIPRHFKVRTFSPIKYLSCDRMVTWSVYRSCILRRSFTSQFQNCDLTNIHCVAIENTGNSHQIWRYFTATERMLGASQFGIREVKQRIIIQTLCTSHVTIQWELRYIIGAKQLPKW
jgi:hypothetical protein